MGQNSRFMVFFLIVLTFVTLVNLYIFHHTRTLLPVGNGARKLSIALFWIIAFSYILGRFSERAGMNWLSVPLVKAGSWWLGAMIYLTLLFLLADILRGLSVIPGLKGVFGFPWLSEKGKWVSLAIYIISGIILLGGYLNSRSPVVRKQIVVLNKAVPGGKFRAVLVSDLHLGMMISNGQLTRLVTLINEQNADVILLAGDIFDEDLGPVIRNNLGDLLKNLRAKEGVYAILGNHEFYGNAAEAQQYLENHHITVLRDSVAILPGGISIIGREDITSRQMFRKERKSLEKLLGGVDLTKPVIVMDHQPFKLRDAAANPIDLQVSGHTHHGQLWPFNYITNAIYEIGRGYRKINNTHFYISPGVGTWGPPIRTSCRPEITVLEITGK